MSNSLRKKIKALSKTTGVYLFRDNKGKVIYVGKAVNLKNRVKSYFDKSEKEPKAAEMITRAKKLDTITCGSEFEALILESEFIKRYKPKYNVKLKDDKGYVYIKISSDDYPRVTITREVVDTGARYLGPFIDAGAVRSILKVARKIFPYCTCRSSLGEVCLYYHLGLCRGHDEKYISKKEYQKDINGLIKLFSGKTSELEKTFTKSMKISAREKKYEIAAEYRDKIRFLEKIKKSHFISERDLSADKALIQLKKNLNMAKIPKRIECFDVSNILGTSAVGSMAVFLDGISSPKDYRRFKIRTVKGSNDFAMMAELLARRFKKSINQDNKIKKSIKGKNSKLPDLVILDGGKGQLSAVLQNVIIPEEVIVIALAKRQEEIFFVEHKKQELKFKKISLEASLPETHSTRGSFSFQSLSLPKGSEAYFLVQRIRDEAHRFAVTYHRKVRSREFFESSLDTISGVGPKTKRNLIKEFGSIEKIKKASIEDISKIVSKKLATKIKEIF